MKQCHFKMIVLLTTFVSITPILKTSEVQKASEIQIIVESIISAKQDDVVRQSLTHFRNQEIVPATDHEIGNLFQTLIILMPSDHSCLEHESAQRLRQSLQQGPLKKIQLQLHNGPKRIALLDQKYGAIREITQCYYSILRLEQKGLNQYISPDGWIIDLDSLLEMGPSTKINGSLVVKQPLSARK